jgi:hypothetical protein
MKTYGLWVLGTVALLAVVGCGGEGAGTYVVSGEVTFDGEPVKDGDIMLEPVEPGKAPDAGKIRDGKFEFRATPGKKKVKIQASRIEKYPAGRKGAMGETEGPVDYIPERYNAKTELTEEVSAGGTNKFTFALKSAKSK